jgi:hypothetical protein
MTPAAQSAREKIRAGMARPLAIWKAAQECGVNTATVARELSLSRRNNRRGRSPVPAVVNGWWNN